MKSLLAKSFHAFRTGNLNEAIMHANSHLELTFGVAPLAPITIADGAFTGEWAIFLLKGLRSGHTDFPMGLLAGELWGWYPSQALLEALVLMDYSDQESFADLSPSEAFSLLRYDLVTGILRESAANHFIQPNDDLLPFGFLPVADAALLERIEAEQPDNLFTLRITEALRDGILAGTSSRFSLSKQTSAAWLRVLLADLFLRKQGSGFGLKRIQYCQKQKPYWVAQAVGVIDFCVGSFSEEELAYMLSDAMGMPRSQGVKGLIRLRRDLTTPNLAELIWMG